MGALRALVQALELVERELDFCLRSTKDMLWSAAVRSPEPAAEFLRVCAQGMDTLDGQPFSGLWRKAASERLTALKPCDFEVLMSVGAVLGRYESEGQRNSVALARTKLNEQLSDAVEERRRQGRVYGALSVTAGAFLVIMLL